MFKDFLYFTRTERMGVLVLAVLALLLLALPRLFPDRSQFEPSDFTFLAASIKESKPNSQVESSPVVESSVSSAPGVARPFVPNEATNELLKVVGLSKQSIRAWMSYLRKGGGFYEWKDIENFRALSDSEREQLRPYLIFTKSIEEAVAEETETTTIELVPFDPNRVEEAALLAMGVPPKAANNWLKFLASGGHFQKPDDIQKIYGLPAALAESLMPYLQLAPVNSQPVAFNEAPSAYDAVKTNVIVDINRATAAEWQELRGIGPAYSKRIVNFRDKLGGFVSVEQVAETYGLPDSTFQAVYLQLRPSAIYRFLSINTLGVEELAAHPYLSWNNAKAIVGYREEHGPYQNAEDLGKLYGLTEKVKKNIVPYLVFE